MPPHNLEDYRAEIILAYLHSIATSGRAVTGTERCKRQGYFRGQGKLCELLIA